MACADWWRHRIAVWSLYVLSLLPIVMCRLFIFRCGLWALWAVDAYRGVKDGKAYGQILDTWARKRLFVVETFGGSAVIFGG
jgi:hypothetical protein